MDNIQVPFRDLIDAFPDLFGRDGSKRRELEQLAENLGVDKDHVNGIDDGEGPMNMPVESI